MGNATSNNRVYVDMLLDTLKKKEKILSILYEKTKLQQEMLLDDDMDLDEFQKTIDDKGEQIDELNQLDEGFDTLFRSLEKEITANRDAYREEIKEMQGIIARVSEKGIQIQALEEQNSERVKMYLAKKRKVIREFHVSKKTAATYYQNMADAHKPQQAYFLNEKK